MPDKLYISQSKIPNSDRGVFANVNIKRGESIETCLFIEIPKHEISRLEESIFINYVYFFGKNKERMLLALGYGSIYNHSYIPNAKYEIKANEGIIKFISIKNIKRNEEITVNYVQGTKEQVPLWFF